MNKEHDFWTAAYCELVMVGFDAEYTEEEVERYKKHEEDWPEGERNYLLLIEGVIGRAICDKLGVDIYEQHRT